jgi:chromate transporter
MNYRRLKKRGLGVLIIPMSGVGVLSQVAMSFSFSSLFLIFLKIGAVLYGSGYVLLAFLRADFVVRLGWLTDQQLLDALAIGQVTPGPVSQRAIHRLCPWRHTGVASQRLASFSFLHFVAISNPRSSNEEIGVVSGLLEASMWPLSA